MFRMISMKTYTICLVLATLVLCANDVLATTKKHTHHTKVYVPEPCKKDNGEAAGLIKKAILAADYVGVAELINKYCGEVNIAKGFDFTGSEELLKPTKDRLNDPDIVSFKAVAYHSLKTKEYERLANIFLYAAYGEYLLTYDEVSSCVCTEKIVGQEAEVIDDDKHHKPKYKANVFSSDGYVSKWEVDASVSTAKDDKNYNSVPCHWSAKVQVSCKSVSENVIRPLTEEELAIKRKDLTIDFSDESYMKSIVDNSYFADLVPQTQYSHKHSYSGRKLTLRELLQDKAFSIITSFCYNCRPRRTCCRESSDCADSSNFCPSS